MSYNNVSLWFARDVNKNVITISEVNKNNRSESFSCPICGSELRPKAINSKRIAPHFAHVDSSKCTSETMIHWWFKHKFLEPGDKFIVISDKKREYICKKILVEESHKTCEGEYRPDITITTIDGKTIYFEFNYSNSKK